MIGIDYYALPPVPTWVVNQLGPVSYEIIDVRAGGGASNTFTNDVFGDPLTAVSVLADVIRRAVKYEGTWQFIGLGSGFDCDITYLHTFTAKTNRNVGYWANNFNPNGPFRCPNKLTFYSLDLQNRARIRRFFYSRFIKTETGGVDTPASGLIDEIEFRHVEVNADGDQYCLHSSLGKDQFFGLFRLWDVDFTGDANPNTWVALPGNGTRIIFDGDMCVRSAYQRWDVRDCRFRAFIQHGLYGDMFQGPTVLRRNQTLPSVLSSQYPTWNGQLDGGTYAGLGPARTMFQSVGRSSEGTNSQGFSYEGSSTLFPFGDLEVVENSCTGAGLSGATAYTFLGTFGKLTFHRNSCLNSQGGGFFASNDDEKGLRTTAGLFLSASDNGPVSPEAVKGNWPLSGTAFNFWEVDFDAFIFTTSTEWTKPRTPVRFDACAKWRIGDFLVQINDPTEASRAAFWAWEVQDDGTGLKSPIDNGPGSISVDASAFPNGWSGYPTPNKKMRYGEPSTGNAQGFPAANVPNSLLDGVVQDVILGNPTAYPFWPQVGPGTYDVGDPLFLRITATSSVAAVLEDAAVADLPPGALGLGGPPVDVPDTAATPPAALGLTGPPSSSRGIVHPPPAAVGLAAPQSLVPIVIGGAPVALGLTGAPADVSIVVAPPPGAMGLAGSGPGAPLVVNAQPGALGVAGPPASAGSIPASATGALGLAGHSIVALVVGVPSGALGLAGPPTIVPVLVGTTALGLAAPPASAPVVASPSPAAFGLGGPPASVPRVVDPPPAALGLAAEGTLVPAFVPPGALGLAGPGPFVGQTLAPPPGAMGLAGPGPAAPSIVAAPAGALGFVGPPPVIAVVVSGPPGALGLAGGQDLQLSTAVVNLTAGVVLVVSMPGDAMPVPDIPFGSVPTFRIALWEVYGPGKSKPVPISPGDSITFFWEKPDGTVVQTQAALSGSPSLSIAAAALPLTQAGRWRVQAVIAQAGGTNWPSETYAFDVSHQGPAGPVNLN